jgi:hypothetical protein
MIAILLIALAAGAASALMFASIISGALISLLLVYFSPLPLMVAGLGWGPLAATIGGIAAALSVGAIFGPSNCIVFAIMMALPAWWLGHLALLGRPVAIDAQPHAAPVEWYPVGRLLLWIGGFAVLATMATLFAFGTDAASITEAMRAELLRAFSPLDAASSDEIRRRVDVFISIAPAAAAGGTMIMLMLNLWLAAKITATSGRMHRPWPTLQGTELPAMTLAALSAAIAFCFTGGLLAILAQTVTSALMLCYTLTGLAVMHTLTLALKRRALWLSCSYALLVLSGGWLVVPLAIVGIADAIFGLRQRFLRRRPPPLPAS